MKKCCRCGQSFDFSAFSKDRTRKDGLQPRCVSCAKAKKQQEILDAIDFENHPKQTKTWIRNLLHVGVWNLSLKDRITYAEELYKRLLERPYCRYSSTKLIPTVDCHLDHKIPTSKGGTNDLDNIEFISKRANQAKSDMTPDEFIAFCQIVSNWAKLN